MQSLKMQREAWWAEFSYFNSLTFLYNMPLITIHVFSALIRYLTRDYLTKLLVLIEILCLYCKYYFVQLIS